MLKVTKVLLILIGVYTTAGVINAHGIGMHLYVGSQTPKVWQNFDPDFYDSLSLAINPGDD